MLLDILSALQSLHLYAGSCSSGTLTELCVLWLWWVFSNIKNSKRLLYSGNFQGGWIFHILSISDILVQMQSTTHDKSHVTCGSVGYGTLDLWAREDNEHLIQKRRLEQGHYMCKIMKRISAKDNIIRWRAVCWGLWSLSSFILLVVIDTCDSS